MTTAFELLTHRLECAPAESATVNAGHRDYFDRSLGQVIALRYRSRLAKLERDSDLPFLQRWFEEWAFLQRTLDAPFSGRPDYIWAGGPREDVSNVQVRQTELYISAYLRVLAFAVAEWGMPASYANKAALEALPFVRGLANVRPTSRPAWTFGTLKQKASVGLCSVAESVWRKAERAAGKGQALLALQTTDHAETEFLTLTFRRLRARADIDASGFHREPVGTVPRAIVADELGAMSGPMIPLEHLEGDDANFLSAHLWPLAFPRFTIDLFPNGIELAHPDLFDGAVEVKADSSGLSLLHVDQPVSRWTHWYADWKATHPREIERFGGSATTITRRTLRSRGTRDQTTSQPNRTFLRLRRVIFRPAIKTPVRSAY